jgi:hypothetical protein
MFCCCMFNFNSSQTLMARRNACNLPALPCSLCCFVLVLAAFHLPQLSVLGGCPICRTLNVGGICDHVASELCNTGGCGGCVCCFVFRALRSTILGHLGPQPMPLTVKAVCIHSFVREMKTGSGHACTSVATHRLQNDCQHHD